MRFPPPLTWFLWSALSCTSGSSSSPSPAPAPIPVAPTATEMAPSENAMPDTTASAETAAPAPVPAPAPAVPRNTTTTTVTPKPAATTAKLVPFNGSLAMFQSNCNGCHGASAPALSSYKPTEISQSISGSSPSMPMGRAMSAADKNAMIAYLKTVQS